MKVQKIKLDQIERDPEQPRHHFDEEKLEDLSNSIREVGVHTPIIVRDHPDKQGYFMIVSGERRFRASKRLGLKDIPAVIYEGDKNKIQDIQLIENVQREDLNAVEKAKFLEERIKLLKEQGCENPVETVAKSIGKSMTWVSRKTQILKYSPELLDLARKGCIKDYDTLKKLSKSSKKKQQEAIGLIEKGEFVATEFFKRKRYEKKPEPVENELIETKEKEEKVGILLSKEEIVNLIDHTDYKEMLDGHDNEWRHADISHLKSYLKSFKKWFTECDAG